MPVVAPYGSWKSPITAETIVADSLGLGQVALDGADIYWSEARPAEGGRNAIVRSRDGVLADVLPPPFSARTRVHEYGGGAFTITGGVLYFCNDADQRVYRRAEGLVPEPITPPGSWRYADFCFDAGLQRLLCVCEAHDNGVITNSLVALDIRGAYAPRTLVTGADFYAAPRLSPDGKQLAWLSWNHPDMPWDSATLWCAQVLADGTVGAARHVAGGPDESILQPSFAPDGSLYFVSDRDNWWNLFRLGDGQVRQLTRLDAEVGWPQWIFGDAAYAFVSTQHVLLACNRRGTWELALLDVANDRLETLVSPFSEIHALVGVPGRAAFVGGSRTEPAAVVEFNFAREEFSILRHATAVKPGADFLASPQSIEFTSAHGETAYAYYYAPRNNDFTAPTTHKPPLLVLSHGGPTAATSPALNLKLQFWTSRGFAILDVNYRGSTGFGRSYRRALDGCWGVADVEDCIAGARHLVAQGLVDGKRIAIRGGSAGGFTTLCALAFHDLFRAGAVYYGVSDLEALANDTHKFEQHYLTRLVGPYPERRDLYRARSPIHHAGSLSCPVIFFQGLDDKVVPPTQTEMMVRALSAKQVPVACVEFAGEAHGFRRAENIRRALEAELYFYSRVFDFAPADAIEPVTIEHLAAAPAAHRDAGAR